MTISWNQGCEEEEEKQMSARHITWVTESSPEDLLLEENIQWKQLNREMKKNLDGLEQGVQDAKTLVQQTQSKVDKLEASIDKIEEPDKKS
jgi:glutamate mutase epsilon subunit